MLQDIHIITPGIDIYAGGFIIDAVILRFSRSHGRQQFRQVAELLPQQITDHSALQRNIYRYSSEAACPPLYADPEPSCPPASSVPLRASAIAAFAVFLPAFIALELGFGLLAETS